MATKTKSFQTSPSTISSSGPDINHWPAALADAEERHSRAIEALEQKHGNRLMQLEERLTAAERVAADLGGQIKEMR